jgi:hypothetical protein
VYGLDDKGETKIEVVVLETGKTASKINNFKNFSLGP